MLSMANAIHKFKWTTIIQIWQMEVYDFETLLIDVTFCVQLVWTLVFNLLIQYLKNI